MAMLWARTTGEKNYKATSITALSKCNPLRLRFKPEWPIHYSFLCSLFINCRITEQYRYYETSGDHLVQPTSLKQDWVWRWVSFQINSGCWGPFTFNIFKNGTSTPSLASSSSVSFPTSVWNHLVFGNLETVIRILLTAWAGKFQAVSQNWKVSKAHETVNEIKASCSWKSHSNSLFFSCFGAFSAQTRWHSSPLSVSWAEHVSLHLLCSLEMPAAILSPCALTHFAGRDGGSSGSQLIYKLFHFFNWSCLPVSTFGCKIRHLWYEIQFYHGREHPVAKQSEILYVTLSGPECFASTQRGPSAWQCRSRLAVCSSGRSSHSAIMLADSGLCRSTMCKEESPQWLPQDGISWEQNSELAVEAGSAPGLPGAGGASSSPGIIFPFYREPCPCHIHIVPAAEFVCTRSRTIPIPAASRGRWATPAKIVWEDEQTAGSVSQASSQVILSLPGCSPLALSPAQHWDYWSHSSFHTGTAQPLLSYWALNAAQLFVAVSLHCPAFPQHHNLLLQP